MRAILSHPYAGALYWWFSLTSGRFDGFIEKSQADKNPGNSYYRTLYGDVDANIDIALACLVIFDEIILPAADTVIAGANLAHGAFSEPAFGISGHWDFTNQASELVRKGEAELVEDVTISQILRRVPRLQRGLIVMTAVTDLLLMQEFNAPVVCKPGRAAIIRRLVDLGVVPMRTEFRENLIAGSSIDKAARQYVQLTGLTFGGDDAGRLSALKWSDSVRKYASEFQRVLTTLPEGDDALWIAIAEARRSGESSSEISGYFSATSRAFSLVSLVPGVGLIAGPVAVLSDWAGVGAERRSQNARWYELDVAISQRRSMLALDEQLHKRGLDR